MAHVLDGCVHQDDLELSSRRELFGGDRQPAFQNLSGLGAASGEPAHQLFPGRRGQEHQAGVRRHALNLARPGQVDLEQAGHACLELGVERLARRAVPVAREPGPLQQCPAGDQPVELVVIDKVILAPLHFPGARAACRRRHGNPDLRTSPAEFRDDRALPDPGGPGEHGQPRMHRGRDRGAGGTRPPAALSDIGTELLLKRGALVGT